jgi:hypothetical protein
VLRVAQHTIRLAGALAAAVVLGCAGHPPAKSARALSSRYFGVWMNIGPSFHNWWEIGPSGAVTYGYDGADGACCVFRLMPGHSSGASRAGIPDHAGPAFREMPGCSV